MSKQAQIFEQSSGTMQVCVSFLPWVCSVIDHRRHQNVVKASVPHSPANRVPLLCFYNNHLDVVCDLFLNRRKATWNLFVFKVEYTILEPDKPDTFGEIPFENLEIYPMCVTACRFWIPRMPSCRWLIPFLYMYIARIQYSSEISDQRTRKTHALFCVNAKSLSSLKARFRK